MFGKNPNDITRPDLEALIENEVSESKSIDYKQTLPGTSDGERKEFLADVCSFANSGGGYVFFGISEKRDADGKKTGLPEAIEGCEGAADEIIRRLDEMARTGIAPRISVEVAAVEGCTPSVFVLRVRESWSTPHMVTYKGTSRFYARTSAGKYQLDVGEIRHAFLASEDLPRRLREFRADRVSKILARETPASVDQSSMLVLHLVPVNATDPGANIEPKRARERANLLQPMETNAWNHRYNFDGFLAFRAAGESVSNSYVQVFRSGAIEAVKGDLLSDEKEGVMLSSGYYEQITLRALHRLLEFVAEMDFSPPFVLMLSLLRVRGATLRVDRFRLHDDQHPFDRDHLLLPETLIESLDEKPEEILRPLFDAVWQSAGFERSFNYTEEGEWNPKR